jgi:hypothetical protein
MPSEAITAITVRNVLEKIVFLYEIWEWLGTQPEKEQYYEWYLWASKRIKYLEKGLGV